MSVDPTEIALLRVLEQSAADWSIRLLLAEKFQNRGAVEELNSLIHAAPIPPENPEQLHKAVDMAGLAALPQAQAYVTENPIDPYGHEVLGHLLEGNGEIDRARKHLQVSEALRGSSLISHSEPSSIGTVADEVPAVSTMPEHELDFQDAGLALETEGSVEPAKRTGSKVVAVASAIIVHIVIGILAALLVILPRAVDEAEIVAEIVAPPTRKLEVKKREVMKRLKDSSAASAAAAPMAQLMRANAVAKISLPNVTKTSTGPLGIGEASMGDGIFGGSGSVKGSADGATLFGGAGASGLSGKFYDFKRDEEGKPTGVGLNVNLFGELVREFADGPKWKVPSRKHFTSPTVLTANVFFYPAMPDTAAGEAFQAKETGPGMWIAHYSGTIVPPESGSFRLVGWGDNLLAVKIGSKMVLDASDRNFTQEKFERAGSVKFPRKGDTPVFAGEYFSLRSGAAVTCDIIIGDAGGIFCAGVHIQKRGVDLKVDEKTGIPKLPLFVTGPVPDGQKKLYKDYLDASHFSGPVFNTRK